MKPELPIFYSKFFKWFCEPEIYEELQGDLEEGFMENMDEFGIPKARRIYRKKS